MRIGIGLPVTTIGATGPLLLDWARQAEERGFESLGTIDRIAYPGFESMAALAGAAAVTSRLLLRTNVLLGPTRSPLLLAKQAATVDQLSGGRFRLGLGIGRRPADYEATDTTFGDRGRRLDRALARMAAEWASDDPATGGRRRATPDTVHPGGVPISIGGSLDVALPRVLAHGSGWTAALRTPEEMRPLRDRLCAAWEEAGREGEPEVVAMHYFALGDDADVDYIHDYYGHDPAHAAAIAAAAIRSAEQAADTVVAFRDVGVDEYIFVPTMPELSQVHRLADAVLA